MPPMGYTKKSNSSGWLKIPLRFGMAIFLYRKIWRLSNGYNVV